MITLLLFIVYAVYAIALAAALARAGLRNVTKIPPVSLGGPLTRVLIIGATGGTGRQLVTQALERGLMVTALVRRPQTLSVQHPHLTVVQGDVLDCSSLSGHPKPANEGHLKTGQR